MHIFGYELWLIILIGLLELSLFLAFSGDMLQYAARIASSLYDHPNLSTHIASLCMLINRIGAAIALMIIGYMIDSGFSAKLITEIYAIFSLILSFSYLFLYKNGYIFLFYAKKAIVKYYGVEISSTSMRSDFIQTKIKYDIAVVYVVSLLGFFFPSVAAAYFTQFKATLLQSGFILNSFATLYFALVVEKRMALTLNDGSIPDKLQMFSEFMLARFCGSFFTSVSFYVLSLSAF